MESPVVSTNWKRSQEEFAESVKQASREGKGDLVRQAIAAQPDPFTLADLQAA